MPRLKNIYRRVVVTTQGQSTVLAFKHAVFKLQFLLMSAPGASASGAFPTVYEHHLLAPFERHPFQDVDELREAQVGDLAPPQAFHRCDIQVFKDHRIIFITEIMRQLEYGSPGACR